MMRYLTCLIIVLLMTTISSAALQTENLVLHMDAANPGADSGNYWSPLVGPSGGGELEAVGSNGTKPTLQSENVPGGYLQYYNFGGTGDGASQVGDLGTDVNFDYDQDFSIEAWTRIPEIQPGNGGKGYIFGDKWEHAFASGYRLTARDVGSGQYKFEFEMRDRMGEEETNYYDSTSNLPYSSTQWVQVVATYDADGSNIQTGAPTVRFWINGGFESRQDEAVIPTEADFTTTDNVAAMGTAVYGRGSPDQQFKGDISILRVYDKLLTSNEVDGNYQEGLTVIPEPATVGLLATGFALLGFRRKRV